MKKNRQGFTKQGIRDLNHLRGKSVGRKFELPTDQTVMCDHPTYAIRENRVTGDTTCSRCNASWDFNGHPYQ